MNQPAPEGPAQNSHASATASEPGYDEWRDYDPRGEGNTASRRHLETAGTAAAFSHAEPNQNQPAQPAYQDRADHTAQPEHQEDSTPAPPPGLPEQPVHHANPVNPQIQEQQASHLEQGDQQRQDQQEPKPHHEEPEDYDVDRQTEEVVEMLSPMEGNSPPSPENQYPENHYPDNHYPENHHSDNQQPNEDTAEQPKATADPPHEEQKEPVRTWDMESFTRGLGDM
jgi:hypothetical protein